MAVRSLARFPLSIVATTTVGSAASSIGVGANKKFLVIATRVWQRSSPLFFLVLIVRRLSWQHLASQNRVNLEKQRLDTAVENMMQGLTLFDRFEAARRCCNQRYLKMYGLSARGGETRLLPSRSDHASKRVGIDPGRSRRRLCARIREPCRHAEEVGHSADPRTDDSIDRCHRACPMRRMRVATHEDITERSRQETECVLPAGQPNSRSITTCKVRRRARAT